MLKASQFSAKVLSFRGKRVRVTVTNQAGRIVELCEFFVDSWLIAGGKKLSSVILHPYKSKGLFDNEDFTFEIVER